MIYNVTYRDHEINRVCWGLYISLPYKTRVRVPGPIRCGGHDLATALPPPAPRERRQGPSRLGGWTHVVNAIFCGFFFVWFSPKKFTKKNNGVLLAVLCSISLENHEWFFFELLNSYSMGGECWWVYSPRHLFFFQWDSLTGLGKIEVLDVWFLHTSSTSKKHTRMQLSLLLLGLTLGPRKCIETLHMDVSENSGTPKSSILIGFSIINHPFWDTTIFGNTHIRNRRIPCWIFLILCIWVVLRVTRS